MSKQLVITLIFTTLIAVTNSLQVALTATMPTFCFLTYQERKVTGYSQLTGEPEYTERLDSDSVEFHYSVSGLNQDEVLFSVYRQDPLPHNPRLSEQKQIHSFKGQPDGYYKAEYGTSRSIEVCFTRTDKEEKLVTFLVNQLTKSEEFAQMTRLELVTSRLKNMQSLFDIISLNL